MATQDEARQAILDAIERLAPAIPQNQVGAGEQIKALAEAWVIVKRREGGRSVIA